MELFSEVFAVFSFIIGAVVASFLNVVIWRVPRGESIVSPPSHCPKCNTPIKWYQNVPILSYLALRGKCANCKAPISPRYILIELLGGVLFLAAFWRFGWSIATLVVWAWIALMIVGSMIDYDLKLLPDFVTVGGMILGVAAHALCTGLVYLVHGIHSFEALYPLIQSLCGLIFGFSLLWLIRFFGSLAFKREAMGMGDVFLMGAIGALFGPKAVLVVLVGSSFFGSIVGLSLVALSKAKLGKFVEIPYGPYICLGCLVWIFCGPELLTWYVMWA